MDDIMRYLVHLETTPSELFTYELKAGDVRWDGNQLERWGYFPSDVVSIDGDIPTLVEDQIKLTLKKKKKRNKKNI